MGTYQNRLGKAALTFTHYLCFEQKCLKYQNISDEIFIFTAETNLCILYGQIFVILKFCLEVDEQYFLCLEFYDFNNAVDISDMC